MRYVATLIVQVAYDADDRTEAEKVARELEDSFSVPTPRGRGASLETIASDVAAIGQSPT